MALSTSAALLDLVTQLAQKRPFRHQDVATATGHSLHSDAASSNSYFTVYHSASPSKGPETGGAFAEVELREARGKEPEQGGLIRLQLASGKLCVSQKEVQERFGTSPSLAPPTPHQPADAPLYLVYPQDWGQLSFGFARQGSECLTTVVLDAIKS